MAQESDALSKRQDYGSVALEDGVLYADPLGQISTWVEEADQAGVY